MTNDVTKEKELVKMYKELTSDQLPVEKYSKLQMTLGLRAQLTSYGWTQQNSHKGIVHVVLAFKEGIPSPQCI